MVALHLDIYCHVWHSRHLHDYLLVYQLSSPDEYDSDYRAIDGNSVLNGTSRAELASTKRAAKYMIIYPTIYVFCTLPLAGGRLAAMTGVQVLYWYYCLAGSAITSCGWLDVLLYAVTRRVIIFAHDPPPKTDNGLNTFGWHEGPRFYGTTTTIEGPLSYDRAVAGTRVT